MNDKNNTDNQNTGNQNTGYRNTGYLNTGDWNTGDLNTGYRNTGDRNTGNWNTGDRHAGCFNTESALQAYYFGKLGSVTEWDAAEKPDWIYLPKPTTWVLAKDMTEQQKIDHPTFHTCEGYLRINDMGEEWWKAYDTASEEEIQQVRDLPNFDLKIFEEITGLDLSVAKPAPSPREIVVDGVTYIEKGAE